MQQPVRFVFYLHAPIPACPLDAGDPLFRALFRTVTYSYLPCLRMLERLATDAVPTGITLALSPSLAALLESPGFVDAYGKALDEACKACAPSGADSPPPAPTSSSMPTTPGTSNTTAAFLMRSAASRTGMSSASAPPP